MTHLYFISFSTVNLILSWRISPGSGVLKNYHPNLKTLASPSQGYFTAVLAIDIHFFLFLIFNSTFLNICVYFFILTSLKIADGPVNYRGLFYKVKLLLLSCCRSYLVKACQVFISFSTRLVLLRILQQK